MDLVNVAMLVIFLAIAALIPIGCHMTRSQGGKPGAAGGAHH